MRLLRQRKLPYEIRHEYGIRWDIPPATKIALIGLTPRAVKSRYRDAIRNNHNAFGGQQLLSGQGSLYRCRDSNNASSMR